MMLSASKTDLCPIILIFKLLYVELSVGGGNNTVDRITRSEPRNMNDRVMITIHYSLAEYGSFLNSSSRYQGRDLGILVEQVPKASITQLLRTVVW